MSTTLSPAAIEAAMKQLPVALTIEGHGEVLEVDTFCQLIRGASHLLAALSKKDEPNSHYSIPVEGIDQRSILAAMESAAVIRAAFETGALTLAPRWVPVEEGLPGTNRVVWITLVGESLKARWETNRWVLEDGAHGGFTASEYCVSIEAWGESVEAWMECEPTPAPLRGPVAGERDMSDLKPCPFCGATPYLSGTTCQRRHWVQCCVQGEHADTAEQAVEVWNTRPIEDALQRRVDELENQFRDLSKAAVSAQNEALVAQEIARLALDERDAALANSTPNSEVAAFTYTARMLPHMTDTQKSGYIGGLYECWDAVPRRVQPSFAHWLEFECTPAQRFDAWAAVCLPKEGEGSDGI